MKSRSRTVGCTHQDESQDRQWHLPHIELLADVRAELMELVVAFGLRGLTAWRPVGPPSVGRATSTKPTGRRRATARLGTERSRVGGRKAGLRRPVRRAGAEVPLPMFQAFAQPSRRRAVACRNWPRRLADPYPGAAAKVSMRR